MALLYGGPRGRTVHDADLAVLPEHLSGAVRCLEESGFVRRGSETRAEYSEFMGNSPGFAGNRAITLYGEVDCEIDLHWDLSGSGAVRLWERASPAGRRSAARLQEHFHYQLEHGRLDKDIFYLVHSRPWRQVLRGLGTDWSGYWNSEDRLK